MKNSKAELIEVWQKEYQIQGIPSSYRLDPSQTLVHFIGWLEKRVPLGGVAADIGCGLGRNSLFLASKGFKVLAVDLLKTNVDHVNQLAIEKQMPIQAYAEDVANQWPIDSNALDIAIDIFCYKHICDKQKQKKYREELWRTLKPGGYFFISLASSDDGYYGPLLNNSPEPNINLIVDPHSNIPSLLYSLEELSEEFMDLFNIVKLGETYSESPMYGKNYPRVVLNCVFRKNG